MLIKSSMIKEAETAQAIVKYFTFIINGFMALLKVFY